MGLCLMSMVFLSLLYLLILYFHHIFFLSLHLGEIRGRKKAQLYCDFLSKLNKSNVTNQVGYH